MLQTFYRRYAVNALEKGTGNFIRLDQQRPYPGISEQNFSRRLHPFINISAFADHRADLPLPGGRSVTVSCLTSDAHGSSTLIGSSGLPAAVINVDSLQTLQVTLNQPHSGAG